MDERVATWIIEFLLRKPIDENIIDGVLSCLPISINDNRLKRTILLRKLESETLNGSVSEKLLELLEIIDELDHREGKITPDLLKDAYCLVAVDCTVRFLEQNVEENGKYFESVERIWRNRVCMMDNLASEKSNRWLGDIEAAVWDSGICEKIWMRNTRNDALKAVKVYLKEAWESMGPAFLESVAKNYGNKVEEFCHGKDGGDTVVGSENPCRVLVVNQGAQKGQASVRYKHVAVKRKRPRGAKIFDTEEGEEDAEESINLTVDVPARKVEKVQETLPSNAIQPCAKIHVDASQAAHTEKVEDAEESMNVASDVLAQKVDKLQETPQSNSMQPCAAADIHVDASQEACTEKGKDAEESMNVASDVPAQKVDKLQETMQSNSMKPCAAAADVDVDASQAALNESSIKAKDNKGNVNAVKTKTRPVKHTTAEVNKVQYALRSSSSELHASVTDPLPEALKLAETLSPTEVKGNRDAAVENQTGPEIHATPKMDGEQQAPESSSVKVNVSDRKSSPDASVPRESIDKSIEHVEKKAKLKVNAQDSGIDGLMEQRHERKCSLMEPNQTSHTLEWNDSIDNLSDGLPDRPFLPSSRYTNRASPLRKYEEKRFRRPKKKWTPQEEDALRDAVKKFGHRWTMIRSCYDEVFNDRTDVDLKDKWRNMMKN